MLLHWRPIYASSLRATLLSQSVTNNSKLHQTCILFSLHLEIDVRDNQELMELIFPIDAIYDF